MRIRWGEKKKELPERKGRRRGPSLLYSFIQQHLTSQKVWDGGGGIKGKKKRRWSSTGGDEEGEKDFYPPLSRPFYTIGQRE